MPIRDATAQDANEIKSELRRFALSLGYKHDYLANDEVITQLLTNFINNHICIVETDTDGLIRGMICGEFQKHPLCPELLGLYEHFWWVKEEHRHSGVGARLLLAFMKRGESADVIRVSLEHNSGVSDASMARFGLRLAEKTYILEK